MIRTVSTLLLSLAFASNVAATGLMECEPSDRNTWHETKALKSKMESEGWQVRHIKEDGGCYEVYGTNPEGQRVEAYYHPVTLEKLLVARRGEILFRKK